MAILSINQAFDYRDFTPLSGLQNATFTPDPVNPDKQYTADTSGNLTFLVQGDNFTYGNNNVPNGGTITEAALYATNAAGLPTSLVFSADLLNIPFAKQVQYLFQQPIDVLKDIFSKNDVIKGSSGNDDIAGFGARDNLTGRGGSDTFHFTEAPTGKNFDTITDFDKAGTVGSDKIALDDAVFAGLKQADIGQMFKNVTSRDIATGNGLDDNDHILYNKSTGALYYDKDGNGKAAGGSDPVLIAVLQSGKSTLHPTLTSGDFLIE